MLVEGLRSRGDVMLPIRSPVERVDSSFVAESQQQREHAERDSMACVFSGALIR